MTDDSNPRLPKLPFIIADVVLVLIATVLALGVGGPPQGFQAVIIVFCAALAGVLGAYPFIVEFKSHVRLKEFELNQDSDEHNEQVEAAIMQIRDSQKELYGLSEENKKLSLRLQDSLPMLESRMLNIEDARSKYEITTSGLQRGLAEQLKNIADDKKAFAEQITERVAALETQIESLEKQVSTTSEPSKHFLDERSNSGDVGLESLKSELAKMQAELKESKVLEETATTAEEPEAVEEESEPALEVAEEPVAFEEPEDDSWNEPLTLEPEASEPLVEEHSEKDEPVVEPLDDFDPEVTAEESQEIVAEEEVVILNEDEDDAAWDEPIVLEEPVAESTGIDEDVEGAEEAIAEEPSAAPEVPEKAEKYLEDVEPVEEDAVTVMEDVSDFDMSTTDELAEVSEPVEEPAPVAKEEVPEKAESLELPDLLVDVPTKPRKSRKSKKEASTLVAQVLIGIGNKPFVRGVGPGLSEDKGVPMEFLEIGKWQWVAPESVDPITCYIYKNDEVMAEGEPIVLEPGQRRAVSPKFNA